MSSKTAFLLTRFADIGTLLKVVNESAHELRRSVEQFY